MGSQFTSMPHKTTVRQVDELCGLTCRPFDSVSMLSFDISRPGKEFYYTSTMEVEPPYGSYDTGVSLEDDDSDSAPLPTP